MEKAVQAAQAIDPNFKAAEASAQGKIAANEANQQFFGNTDSLLRLRAGRSTSSTRAARALGNTMIPAHNTIDNWSKAGSVQVRRLLTLRRRSA